MIKAHSSKIRFAIALIVCVLLVHTSAFTGSRTVGDYVEGVFSGPATDHAITGADVVHQIPSPDSNSHGLTWDGASLWLCGAFSSMIYQLDPADGMVLNSYNSGIASLRGLTFGDGHLWVSDWSTELIYKLVPATGMIVDSFPAPFPGKPNGMAWDDGVLWVSEEDGLIHRVNAANGMLISSIVPPPGCCFNPRGLAWDGTNLWAGYQLLGVIFKLDPTDGSVLDTLNSPSGPFQQGLTFDGQFLWSTGVGDDMVYQIDIGLGPELVPDLDIKPGSCPNSYNRNSHGVLPVALVGSESFDVSQVDLDSLLLVRTDGEGGSVAPNFGPPGPHPTIDDVATPFEGEECDCHEATGDGIDDLMLHFRTDDVVANLDLNSFLPGALVSLTLTGVLNDGTPFEVDDCVRLVPPGTPPGMLAVHSNVTDAWIALSPNDNQLDGGGFAAFVRTFPLSSVVTLTAPETQNGWSFEGWMLTSFAHQSLPKGEPLEGLIPGTNLVLTIDSVLHTVGAIYAPPDWDFAPAEAPEREAPSGKGS